MALVLHFHFQYASAEIGFLLHVKRIRVVRVARFPVYIFTKTPFGFWPLMAAFKIMQNFKCLGPSVRKLSSIRLNGRTESNLTTALSSVGRTLSF